MLPNAFAALAANVQFVVAKIVPKMKDGIQERKPNGHLRWDKVPVDSQGRDLSWTEPNNLLTFDNASQRLKSLQTLFPTVSYGIGYIFTPTDGYVFIDLDNCTDGNNWNPLALALMNAFPGAAVEVSNSGTGLHIVFCGQSPIKTKCRNVDHTIELYTGAKFMLFGPHGAQGDCRIDHTIALGKFINEYMSESSESLGSGDLWKRWEKAIAEGVHALATPIPEDNDLIEMCKRMKKSGDDVFLHGDNRNKFERLWEGDTTGYSTPSGADSALVQILRFATGDDVLRIQKLMLLSGLYREKFDRVDYLPRTILSERGKTTVFYSKEPTRAQSSVLGAESQIVLGRINVPQQSILFEGCVYVADENRILTPGGYLRNQEQFKVLYGGYLFAMDNENEKESKNSWEAFTQSRAISFPKVDSCCFRPDLKPGEILIQEGDKLVNNYYPVTTSRIQGNIAPLMRHLEKFLPDERDRLILICYMAAIVQHKGIKFQWCPLLQGVQGNGKSLLSNILTFCIGYKYSASVKASIIDDKFNDWLYRKIFIVIEEVYTIDNRLETGEKLKDTISNSRQMIETKGLPVIMRDISANFMLNSNHKNAIRLTEDDRRFAVFYTGQQSKADLLRDGMTKEFFVETYDWLQKHNGFSICNEFLHTYSIPNEFNPALGGRAPLTSSTQESIEQSLGNAEQEVLEAIEQGREGFRGGWISSIYLGRFLESIKAQFKINEKRRPAFLESLGYIKHPGLIDGRVFHPIKPDDGKPRLYIKKGHSSIILTSPSQIALTYFEAQKVK